MLDKKSITKVKKLSAIVLTLFLVIGLNQKIEALTIADIELLISLGLIPEQNSQSARDFINSDKITNTTGNIITIQEGSDKECLIINRNIVKGSSGSLVSALQTFLKSQGHLPASQAITGYYGDVTVQAVVDFQLANKLITTSTQAGAGAIGPITRAKIQEVSCKALQPEPVVATTTVPAASVVTQNPIATTPVVMPNSSTRPPKFTFTSVDRNTDRDKGIYEFKYSAKLEPKTSVSTFSYVLTCDGSAIEVGARDFRQCGDVVDFDVEKRGAKGFTLILKNLSRMNQPISIAVEALNSFGQRLGFAEKTHTLEPALPTFNINANTNTATYSGSNLPDNRICGRQEQLEFIRYVMSTYDPHNPVYLPHCYPGELLCNKSYPPTYCQITNGPTSNDLCSGGKIYRNGACVDSN